VFPKTVSSRGTEGRSGAAGPATRRSALLSCLMLAALSAVSACSASGTPLPVRASDSETPSPAAPTAAVQDTQDQILKKICQQQKVDVSVNKCREVYSTYPTGFVVDAATDIFDKNGEHIDSCGEGSRANRGCQAVNRERPPTRARRVSATPPVQWP
jgi:hypothetical protein